MPRTRDLRPGFFKNEYLAECAPLARLLFQGLWTLADREGRLEDRPKKIKMELLPYDDCDIEELLNQLVKFNFIVRYEVKGKKVIWIPTFAQNQRIHPKEPYSVLPGLDTDEPRQAAVLPGNSDANRTIPSSPSIPTLPTKPSLPPYPPVGEAADALESKLVLRLVNGRTGQTKTEYQWLKEQLIHEVKRSGYRNINQLGNLSEFIALNPVAQKLGGFWLSRAAPERMAALALVMSKSNIRNELTYAIQAIEAGWDGYKENLPTAEEAISNQDYEVTVNG